MARGTRTLRIKALVSFNDMRAGDEGVVELAPRIQGWINAGLVKVVEDVTYTSRSRRPEPNDHKRVTAGAEGSVPASGEPGEGTGPGEHGAPEELDPS